MTGAERLDVGRTESHEFRQVSQYEPRGMTQCRMLRYRLFPAYSLSPFPILFTLSTCQFPIFGREPIAASRDFFPIIFLGIGHPLWYGDICTVISTDHKKAPEPRIDGCCAVWTVTVLNVVVLIVVVLYRD